MWWLLLTLTLFASALHAQEEGTSFINAREGESVYATKLNQYKIKRVLKKISRENALEIYSAALKKQDPKKVCSYSLNKSIQEILDERLIKLNFKGLIYLLRDENSIDDVVVRILLNAHSVKNTQLIEKDEENIFFPEDNATTQNQLMVIESYEKRFSKKGCFDEVYATYYSELLKHDKKMESYQLEALHLKAFKEGKISAGIYLELEQGRLNKVESTILTLASYQLKIKTLRTQYPLRDPLEKSNFVTGKAKKMKLSRRQKLFENYTDLQIIMMGNVIKKLRSRLEYDAVDISGYKEGVLQEVISLDPMERFRFAIKILRKEMGLLTLNSFFNSRSPDYVDLMLASYEIGVIPSSELEIVASLEEVWNPKKTFWDKAGLWIKTFSSVATIAIPPPYGFIPALVIVVIEATAGKRKKTTENDPTVLF